jgi:flagellar L-ring protein precursor FlgH
MIHHFDIVTTPRGVSVPPDAGTPTGRHVPIRPHARAPFPGTWIGITTAIGLVLSVATSGGAQATTTPPRDGSAPTAAAPARNISWTSSRRTFAVGDVIKVVVDEYALAQASKDNNNSASRSRNMTLGIDPPSSGTVPTPGIDGSVATGDAGQSRQQGRATRDTRYVGEIPVRVVAVTPEGLLQVRGTKTIDVDKNKQTLMLSGFVRPIDVGASDMIRSDLIADAEISYQSRGSLGKPRNGIVSKIIGILWP